MNDRSKGDGQAHLGIDLGSVSVKVVVLAGDGRVVEEHYVRHYGHPLRVMRDLLADVLTRVPSERIGLAAATGAGRKRVAELVGAAEVNEVVAQARATARLHPEVRTIIEIGGEDSKLIFLQAETDGDPASPATALGTSPSASLGTSIADFAMNTICAAGTGSFLDQQASRLGVSIEEFSELALRSEQPPRLAGRCSVFAKSDMIHLQQKGTQPHDIIAGLCLAMARNFKSTVGSARRLDPPVSFQGGVAANEGMVRAFERVLEMEPGTLVIPQHFASMGAIGAIYAAQEQGLDNHFRGLDALDQFLAEQPAGRKTTTLEPLSLSSDSQAPYQSSDDAARLTESGKLRAYLGVDVGSISTNVVVIDDSKRVLSKRYLMTAGRPLEAVKRGLAEVGAEVGDRVEICGACTTGSGRYLTGDFIGADVVKNEITAQARGAVEIDPEVDTIFEIGGQDSKYVSLDHGAIVDFEMNKVCAAGTGSFLEEQAEKLGISIIGEFGELALQSQRPANLGERCTVFMETELVRQQQAGTATGDLVAGLSYSIVMNYLNRVVAGKRVGERIFFQGGTAANRGVVAAFEKVTGKPITVPEHHEVTGAIGCALIAREHDTGEGSKFKGFDLSERKYEVRSFECRDCPNRCEINRVTVEGERPRFYGSRCEKYDVERRSHKGDHLPDLFAEREQLLLNTYQPSRPPEAGAKRVGMPRSLLFHDLFPLWNAFFSELGFEVVVSGPTTKAVIHRGCESSVVETCFPMKVALGHTLDLLDQQVDYLFVPSVINLPRKADEDFTDSFVCPYVQSFPYTMQSAVDVSSNGVQALHPVVWLYLGPKHLADVMGRVGGELGKGKGEVARAVEVAFEALGKFQTATRERGEEVMAGLGADDLAVVVVSRSYNGCDPGANLEIPRRLRDMGVLAIPMDFLPLDSVAIGDQWPNMYWRYGQKIMSAAEIIAHDDRLTALYLTNFGCGPDSFITKFFRQRMGEKPYLQIEVDEHSADAGMITRCEAFLDSLQSTRGRRMKAGERFRTVSIASGVKRTVLIPNMADHAHGLAAAMEASGMPAEVLPEPDDETLYWGRKYTSGRECFPCIVTTGDMVKFTKRPDFDRKRHAFFMGGSGGPCRFGQYNALQRMVLDELGYPDVPIWAPNQASSFYNDLGLLGRKFLARGWQSIVAIDMLYKALCETRPYEVNTGETERVYWRAIDDVCDAVRSDGDLIEPLRRAREAFGGIEVDRGESRPVIGLVGEIYVRSNRFSNQHIVEQVETLGGEVWMAPVYEWFLYRNFRRAMRSWLDRDYKLWGTNLLKDWFMKRDEHRLASPFDDLLRNAHEPPTREVLEMADPYLHRSFEGEAILTVGKAVDFARKGLSGVISAMPFTCMPGTISQAILKRVKEEEGGFPFLNMVYDGTEQANTETRVEAFVHQCREYLRRRGGVRAHGD